MVNIETEVVSWSKNLHYYCTVAIILDPVTYKSHAHIYNIHFFLLRLTTTVSCAKYYTQISSVSVDVTPVVSQLNLTTAGFLASVGLSGIDSICE